MKYSITQEHGYGCGVACFAYIKNISYKEAIRTLGRKTSVRHGWRPSDLVCELNRTGFTYRTRYVRKQSPEFTIDGTVVLIERSEPYPVGHYLVYYHGRWMDPWINLPQDNDLTHAKSGFRNELPGKAMYALLPQKKYK